MGYLVLIFISIYIEPTNSGRFLSFALLFISLSPKYFCTANYIILLIVGFLDSLSNLPAF